MGEWRVENLGDLVWFEYGSALDAGSRTGSGFPVYGSNGVVGSHDKALVAGPGIVIGRKGSVGALQWSEGDFWPIDTTYWVRPRVELDLRWMREALALAGLEALNSSTGVPGLNRGDAYERSISVPPLEEQRRIAEILDTLDETIQITERVIAKLAELERGLCYDLLAGSAKGARSESWKRCRIGDFADVQRGASPRPIDNPAWFAPNGPGWIRISDVTAADDVLLCTRDKLSPAGAARSRRVFPGDVIMSIAATIGVTIIVGIEACYHDGFVRIDHDASIIPEFLVMLLEHHKDVFLQSGQTGTQANINSSIVAATEVSLPSLEEQSAIVAAASSIRRSIRTEKEAHRTLSRTRAGLSADLLSGRVRTVAA